MSAEFREPLRLALKRTASALESDGVLPFALAGGYALRAHGAPESENDVDFVVAEADTERAATVLATAGFEVVRPPEDWLFKAGVDGVTVDVLHRVVGIRSPPTFSAARWTRTCRASGCRCCRSPTCSSASCGR